jgi:hypothetical protein
MEPGREAASSGVRTMDVGQKMPVPPERVLAFAARFLRRSFANLSSSSSDMTEWVTVCSICKLGRMEPWYVYCFAYC